MGDFSRPPAELLADSQSRGYVGLHVEQGVPVLDRDLNLLQDLIAAGIRSLFTRYIGDGVAAGSDAFRIDPAGAPQDFRISAGADGGRGWCLIGGLDVAIDAPMLYKAQPGADALTTPTAPQPDPREDTVYLEAWVEEVEGTPDLDNSADVGMQTSTRLKVRSAVRVAEGGPVPSGGGRVRHTLAVLRRPHGRDTIEAPMIVDRRQRRLTVTDLEQRLDVVERVLLVPAFVPFAPPPALQQFTPSSGPALTVVQLHGTNFDVGRLQVLIGGKAAPMEDAPSSNRAVVKVPTGLTPEGRPATVKMTVQNEVRASTSDLDFTVEPKLVFAAPGQQLQPPNGPPGTVVTVSGFNFNMPGQLVVTVGPAQAPPLAPATNTTLRVRVPDNLTPGPVRVTLALPNDSATTTDSFRVDPIPAPAFTTVGAQFSPPEGVAGTRVVLNGRNFDFTPTVKFGDVAAPSISDVTATQIAVLVPPNLVPAGSTERPVSIVVTTRAGGTATSATPFRARR